MTFYEFKDKYYKLHFELKGRGFKENISKIFLSRNLFQEFITSNEFMMCNRPYDNAVFGIIKLFDAEVELVHTKDNVCEFYINIEKEFNT